MKNVFNFLLLAVIVVAFSACQTSPVVDPAIAEHQKMMDEKLAQETMAKEIGDKYIVIWNSKDLSNIASIVHANAKRYLNDEQVAVNLEEFKASMKYHMDFASDLKVELRDTEIYGNKVYTKWTTQGTNTGIVAEGIPATGKSFKDNGYSVITIEDGRIKSEYIYFNEWNVNKQIGFTMAPPQESAK